jgi:hypothetical protein
VLCIETGHFRDYRSGVVYKKYFASKYLMFPVVINDERVAKRKNFVFGIRDVGAARAWPIAAFKTKPLINDRVSALDVVLIGDTVSRAVRAYERKGLTFKYIGRPDRLVAGDGEWQVTEDALIGPSGANLPRIPGHLSYWFAWNSYLGPESTL